GQWHPALPPGRRGEDRACSLPHPGRLGAVPPQRPTRLAALPGGGILSFRRLAGRRAEETPSFGCRVADEPGRILERNPRPDRPDGIADARDGFEVASD